MWAGDVAVFLRGLTEREQATARLAKMETGTLYDTGTVINTMPFPADAYGARSGFMSDVRKDGLEL